MPGTVVVNVDGNGRHKLTVMGSVDLAHCHPYYWGRKMRVIVLDDLERLEALTALTGRVAIVLTPIGHKGECEICDGVVRQLIGEPTLSLELHEGMKEVKDVRT